MLMLLDGLVLEEVHHVSQIFFPAGLIIVMVLEGQCWEVMVNLV